MRWLCVIFVSLGYVSAAAAEQSRQVRPVDTWARESLGRGEARSQSFRALLDALEASNVIVHVETLETLPAGISGQLRWAASRGGYRYLRISLLRALEANYRAAILGHELQHAREVADADVWDAESMRTLYATIGHQSPGAKDMFDTSAAADVGVRIWLELHGFRKTEREAADKTQER